MFFSVSIFVSSTLSLLSTGLLLIYFIYKKSARTYAFKLVLPVFFYDFLLSLVFVCPLIYYFLVSDPYIDDTLCIMQGVIKVLSINGSFCSTLSISWTLYSFFIRKQPIKGKNPIVYYSPLTIMIPLITALVPLISNNYNHTDPLSEIFCYLIVKKYDDGSTDVIGMLEKIFLSFIPFFITVFLEIYFILRILYYFWKNREERPAFVDIRKLIIYPLFLVLLWSWIMTERFYELLSGGEQLQWLNEFDLQIGLLNGLINSIVYGYISINPYSKKQEQDIHNDIYSEEQSESEESSSQQEYKHFTKNRDSSSDIVINSDDWTLKSSMNNKLQYYSTDA